MNYLLRGRRSRARDGVTFCDSCQRVCDSRCRSARLRDARAWTLTLPR